MRRFFRKLDNSGAALVTAVIVLAFVSILATTIIYLAGSNYRRKLSDRNTRASFYETEEPAEALLAAMTQISSGSIQYAFEHTMRNYSSESSEAARLDAFEASFFEEFEREWDAIFNPGGNDLAAQIEALTGYPVYNTEADAIAAVTDSGITRYIYLDTPSFSSEFVSCSADGHLGYTQSSSREHQQRVVLQGVHIVNIKDGYRSEISTDICAEVPALDWFSGDSEMADSQIDIADYVYYANWSRR